GSNAGVQWLDDPAGAEAPGAEARPRVRVSNDPGSRQEAFQLLWVDDQGAGAGKPVDVYVPPGESRVVRVPPPPGPSTRRTLRLRGDAHGFDNTLFLAAGRQEEATVLYLGTDAADDPAGLLYYLQRVFPDTPRR